MEKQSGQEVPVRQSKYTRMLNAYSRVQFPNIVPILMVISKECKYGSKYPVYKVLKVIAKQFLLNQIECIFLTYLIQQTEWNIRNKILSMNCENVRDIVSCSIDAPEYKCLILYLMVIAYTVKYYLNDDHNDFVEDANKVVPSFKIIFQNWVKKHSNIASKINLKMLNRVYKELSVNLRTSAVDFNMMVDAIIQISPAYTSDRQKKQVKILPHKQQPGKRPFPGLTANQISNPRQPINPLMLPVVEEYHDGGFMDLNPLSSIPLNRYNSNNGGGQFPETILGGEQMRDQELFGEKNIRTEQAQIKNTTHNQKLPHRFSNESHNDSFSQN